MTSAAVSSDDLWSILRGSTRGILATVGADGLPHLTNVHHLAGDDQVIRMTTTTTRVKGRNLLRDPRAVLHVQGEDWFNFAVAEGTVTTDIATEPGDQATAELYDLVTTLRGPAERAELDAEMIDNDRMIVRMAVDRVYGQVVSA